MIKIENLTVRYDQMFALDNINLQLESGIIHGLIGANGAGKSTLIKACSGLISAYNGSILFDKKNIRENRQWQKENCAYAPEDVELLPYLSGLEFLQLIGQIRQVNDLAAKIDIFLDMLDLRSKQDEFLTDLSHGMRQKLAVAAALIGETRFLLFDETLNGFDTPSLGKVLAHLRKRAASGCTILISSHVLPMIKQLCDRVIILENGRVNKILESEEIGGWSATDYLV